MSQAVSTDTTVVPLSAVKQATPSNVARGKHLSDRSLAYLKEKLKPMTGEPKNGFDDGYRAALEDMLIAVYGIQNVVRTVFIGV